jgi:hypothetical protein
MAQQDKQVRVGAREAFAYHSVELVFVANRDRYEVDSTASVLNGSRVLYALKTFFCHNSDHFLIYTYISSL